MNKEFIQNTPEWSAFRRKKIGASDAPIILGVSPWKTPYQLWMEKTTGANAPVRMMSCIEIVRKYPAFLEK